MKFQVKLSPSGKTGIVARWIRKRALLTASAFLIGFSGNPVLPDDSDPGLGSDQLAPIDNEGWVPQDAVSADFNGDGFEDLAVAFAFDDMVRWYLGEGDGNFAFQGEIEVGLFPGTLNDLPRKLAAHDFDGDGFVDLAVLCSGNPDASPATSPSLGILYGTPRAGFEPFRAVRMAEDSTDSPSPQNSLALSAGLIDGDERLDLVVGHFGSHQISVILHRGRRDWKPPLLHAVPPRS